MGECIEDQDDHKAPLRSMRLGNYAGEDRAVPVTDVFIKHLAH